MNILGAEMVAFSREYADGVFRLLFNDKRHAAGLFSAFSGITCSPEDIVLETLSGVITKSMRNDLAFRVRDKLFVFTEHQSSVNPNMPLRDLIYVGATYRAYLSGQGLLDRLYSSVRLEIPTPYFVVLYTGRKRLNQPVVTYSLSSLFSSSPALPNFGGLDLVVPVYDLMSESNFSLIGRDSTLSEYSIFVSTIHQTYNLKLRARDNNLERSERERLLDESISEAINRCITEGILADFLKKHGAEVRKIMAQDLNSVEYEEWFKAAVMAEGMAEGKAAGRAEGKAEGKAEVAKKLAQMGVDSSIILEATGFSG